MERILFLHLFQPFAQFRNPFTFFYAQTFPLPPKSTILGFLENATGKYYSGKFDDTKISIWGYYSSIYWNYLHFIKGNPYLDERGVLKINNKPLYGFNSFQRTPTYQQEILGLNLFLFLVNENEDKLQEIFEKLLKPKKVFHLGRGEDVVFIRKVKFLYKNIDFEEKNIKDFYLKIGTYIKYSKEPLLEDLFYMFPVYSIPVTQKFVFNSETNDSFNEKKYIQTREELFSCKDELKREVKFETVLYLENRQIFLHNYHKALKFEYNNSNSENTNSEDYFQENKINFYLLEDLSWI